MIRHTLTPLLAAALIAIATNSNAATRTWIGGNNDWNGSILNWTGLDEPDSNDDAVFNTNHSVDMAMNNEILSLTLQSSISLDTSTFLLDVNGDIELSDAGTVIRAGQNDLLGLPGTSVSAYNITVNNGASFQNANSTTFVAPAGSGLFDINSGGTLYGNGLIRNSDFLVSPTVVFENDGVIRPGDVSDLFIIVGTPPAARTLTLSASDADAQIDLDGTTGNGAVDVNRNQTLDIDLALSDAFDGTIDLAHNSTLDITNAWNFSGTMDVDNGFVPGQAFPFFIPAIPADVAYLQGGEITMSGGATTINVLDSDGTLQFDAPLTANDGTINNNGLIVFNNDATINSGVNFDMIGTTAGMTVGAGSTVIINDVDMDFDGSGASTNVITVESGGFLDFNLDSFEGNDRADGYLTLNSGRLSLTVNDGSWTMDRRLTLNNSTGNNPVVSGSAVEIGDDAGFNGAPDADVRVTGIGSSQINVPVTWNSDAEVDVDAGATLAVLGFSTFNTVNGNESAQFDGPGDIFFSGGQVNEATTLNFSGGTVGLDGGGAFVILLSAPDFTLDAPLTINAAELNEYGRSIVFPAVDSSVLTVNNNLGGRLNVNLDNPADSWTVNSDGIMNVEGGGVISLTFLTGNRLDMDGTMNVDGRNTTSAPLTIGSTGVVNLVDASANLRINGGDLANTNRLEGGSINGPGELSATNGKALHGLGAISANIDFDGATSELMADDGILTISGAIQDVGVFGTADSDGTLHVVNPWTTSDTNEVRLHGGELVGSTITNDGAGGINGRGLILARVRNDTVINADSGGVLLVDNVTNDWDGPGNAGTLRASGSTLEIRDNASFLFNGTVEATSGTVFASGFELEFDPGSTLRLHKGTYRSDTATDFGGNIEVLAGATSVIQVTASSTFENTSTTTLNDNLRLEDGHSFVEVGATFAGGGALHNAGGHVLTLEDGANVGVLVENDGLLTLGASPGQATVLDYQQNAIGTLEIELEGTGLNDFDRLTATGLMQLDGLLELSLIGGFNPALSDSFTILSAAAGVNGVFNAFDFTAATLDPGLMWDVIYNPTNVELEVVSVPSFTADFDNDGDVDGVDLTQWEGDYGGPGSDADADGDSDGADFFAWQRQFGSGGTPLAALNVSAVPEPSTLFLAALAACCGLLMPRQKK